MDTDSFIVHIKSKGNYADLLEDVETRFGTSNYEVDRPLSIGKNYKVLGLMKDELERKIMKEFVVLRPKMCSYIADDRCVDKKVKSKKKCVIKRDIHFQVFKKCL